MKTISVILLAIVMGLVVSACGDHTQSGGSTTVNVVVKQDPQPAPEQAPEPEPSTTVPK